jgi:two-component system CheB/CheR fusion protein
MSSDPDPDFEALLEFVRDRRGFDYTGYKRPTLLRRFQKRMDAVGARTYAEYREYLERRPEEYGELFDTILINVTGFFRDPPVWEYVAGEVIPQILEQSPPNRAIRVWSAGCATGEEAYTVAMLFAEALGEDGYRERVKIYATDVDDDTLLVARHAVYPAKQVAGISEALRERYLQPIDHRFLVRNELRRGVVFGRNDMLQDPPISRVDLLVSRNTLMYFGHEAQERILANFFFALRPRGFLVLGKAEALDTRTDLFQAYDLKRRVFVKNHAAVPEPRLRPGVLPAPAELEPGAPGETLDALHTTAFEQAPLAQIVVDTNGTVSAVNHAARAMFQLKPSDAGQRLQDLEVSYRPVELRSLIDQVQLERRPVATKDVTWGQIDGRERHLDVQVSPLFGPTGASSGVVISFADVTRYRALHGELEHARRQLETAYEELQSTVEELETTNEELQTTNEELETTNEELQSTNEELETMNEELQSTNEELETMNDELRERTDDALQANAFLSSVLASIHQSVVVVDRALLVTAWSRAAVEAWGLLEHEARGEHLLNLDIGIATAELRDPVRRVLAGETEGPVQLRGHDRRGHPVEVTVSFAQLRGPTGEVEGAILIMDIERIDG